jgi:drug/metabolite transporter (DMT)-like permease
LLTDGTLVRRADERGPGGRQGDEQEIGGRVSARAWGYFAAVSILWGMPYLLIKVAVEDGVPPAFIAWVRVVLGAAVLLGLAWRSGVLASLRGRLRWVAAFAVADIAIPFPLIATGEQYVSSSLTAILIAAAPLFVALLALRFDASERATGWRLAGLLIGLAGVVALVGVDVAGRGDELLGAGAILLAAFFYAVGPMLLKLHLADLDPRVTMGASLGVASLVLVPAAADPPASMPSVAAIFALVGLGVLCTAVALVCYGTLIAEVGAGRALLVTYLNPVVAVVLGVTIRGERPGAGAGIGLMLILAGSWLSSRRQRPAPARHAASAGTSVDSSGAPEPTTVSGEGGVARAIERQASVPRTSGGEDER